MPRAGVAAVVATVVLAGAASAAYEVSSRSSAHADVPATGPAPVTLTTAVAPAGVTYGADVRVTGTLLTADGVPLGGRTVDVVAARADAPEAASVIGSPVTDAAGRVSTVVRPAAGSAVWLRFAGEQRLASGLSNSVTVAVAQAVTLRAAAPRATLGTWATRLYGTVAPARAGQVRLERRDGTGWRTEAVGALTGDGRYSFTVRHGGAGSHAYRVVSPAVAAYGEGTATYDLRLAAPPAAAPGTPNAPATPVTGKPVTGRLLVAGDSLAFYLGQQLRTARGARPTDMESRHSSGLTRRDYFDWVGYARRAAATSPGAVVAFLGGNDCQPIRAGWTGKWTSVGTPAWTAEYQRRAAELMTAFGGNGARPVYWIGLPVAQKQSIADCYRMLNAATVAAARSVKGVTWVDSWGVYSVDGRYSDTVEGVKARQDDGIHLTFEGTRLLTRRILPLVG